MNNKMRVLQFSKNEISEKVFRVKQRNEKVFEVYEALDDITKIYYIEQFDEALKQYCNEEFSILATLTVENDIEQYKGA